MLPRTEIRYGYDLLLQKIKKTAILAGIVSDWHGSIRASINDFAPEAPHQRCVAHVLRDTSNKLGSYAFRTERGKEIWYIVRKLALFCKSLEEAKKLQSKIEENYALFYDREKKAFQVIFKTLSQIYMFSKNPETIPRTSNRIENLMGQLEARLKTFRGVSSPKSVLSLCSEILRKK